MLGVEALVVHVDLLAPHLAAQVVLRQRRALVGALLLRPHQHNAPLEALLAERLGGLRAGEARADDHVRLVTAHGNSLGKGQELLAGAGVVADKAAQRRGNGQAPSFWTPRSDMHMCSASRTTPTPLGSSSR